MKYINRPVFLILVLGCCFSVLTAQNFPTETSTLFSGSGNCTTCHSSSTSQFVTSENRKVAPDTHWQSSMMANAAIDPLWQAKVEAEVIENPHLKSVIEDKCLTCHAPMGRTEAKHLGKDGFTMDEMRKDPLSLDGVSCTVCHQIQKDNFGTADGFSGGYLINTNHSIFGPYEEPFVTSMLSSTGYTPTFSNHVKQSELCATCHTLITPYVDNAGDIVGKFPEQMPYFEWKNSIYPDEEKSCQSCHMPENRNDFIIANRPPWLDTKRNPIYEHHFVGGNVMMNALLKDNASALGVVAGSANLDTTIVLNTKSLTSNSVDLSVNAERKNGTIEFEVQLKNKSGHKFPTGFPSRRVFLQVKIRNDKGELLLSSGEYETNGKLLSEKQYHTHYDTISSSDQVQIYETVMGDVDNQVTFTLLKAGQYLKDNRLPPVGFNSNQSYDSLIAITGLARKDKDFNRDENGVEGTGIDKIVYLINDVSEQISYEVKLLYQTTSYPFYENLVNHNGDRGNAFKAMYSKESVPKTIVVSEANGTMNPLIAESALKNDLVKIYPNPLSPFSNPSFYTDENETLSFTIYNLAGELVASIPSKPYAKGEHTMQADFANLSETVYLIQVQSKVNKQVVVLSKL